ncbi:MAG: SDR family oxidoreductase [Myxococcota bacterium]
MPSGVHAGRRVLVTGAGSGIGAAVAARFAEGGATVVVADLDAARGGAVAERIGGRFFVCDVASAGSWGLLVERCLAEVGVPDYVHLNAGIMSVPPDEPFVPLEALSLERYRRIMGINLDGVFFGLRAWLPHLRGRDAAITVTSSVAGVIGVPEDPVYAATKHAVIGLVRSLAADPTLGRLRVNAICPGAVATAITPEAMKDGRLVSMAPDVMAREVEGLLVSGATGEVRLKLSEQKPAYCVEPPVLVYA